MGVLKLANLLPQILAVVAALGRIRDAIDDAPTLEGKIRVVVDEIRGIAAGTATEIDDAFVGLIDKAGVENVVAILASLLRIAGVDDGPTPFGASPQTAAAIEQEASRQADAYGVDPATLLTLFQVVQFVLAQRERLADLLDLFRRD